LSKINNILVLGAKTNSLSSLSIKKKINVKTRRISKVRKVRKSLKSLKKNSRMENFLIIGSKKDIPEKPM